MAKAAAALIELDGVARRIVLCPPGAGAEALAALARAADADALVHDGDAPAPQIDVATRVACRLPLAAARRAARGALRHRMGDADFRHQRAAEARRPYAARR